MKVFCGCWPTRSGTLGILLCYGAIYIGGIVLLSLSLDKNFNGKGLEEWYKEGYDKYACIENETVKDTFWCNWMKQLQGAIRDWQIGIIVVLSVYILLDLIALFGTTKSSRWPLLPWIVLEFIRIFVMMVCTVIAIIIWAVYMDDTKDTSYMIATGIISMILMAMFFYFWLCVVSYFQLLKEIEQIEEIHKAADSPMHKVKPFVAEDGDYDNENPYDNLSVHTTKESLEDTASLESGIKSPGLSIRGSTLHMKDVEKIE